MRLIWHLFLMTIGKNVPEVVLAVTVETRWKLE